MRCFVALPLPPAVRSEVTDVQERLAAVCERADVRWVQPPALHLTLKFLGNLEPQRLDDVKRALLGEVARHHVPRLACGGVGAFPSARRARVVWLGVTEGGEAIALLAEALSRILEPLGFPREPEPFTPHLTLGRVRSPRRGANLERALAACAAAGSGAWTPTEVVLYESHLRPTGAVHEVQARYPLG